MDQAEHAQLFTADGNTMLFEGASLRGSLRGLLFEATVEQRFRNHEKTAVEAIYTFPLPAGAVLLGVDVQIDQRRLTGQVVERTEASARYEGAISEGNSAVLLEHNNDGTCTLNLGNLGPGEQCTIALRYGQTLRFEQRSLRLMIPTVIAPRYGDSVRDGGRAPHQVPTQSIDAEYPFELELHVHGELARAVVASPTHPISVRMAGDAPDSELIVTLGRSAALDRDFVLVLNQLPHDSIGVLAQDFGAKDRYAVLASFCPRLPGADAAQPPAIAVKLLVDCSGSMGGDSIAAARRALTQIVTSFKPGDRFSLSRFGSEVEHRSKALWTLTEATRLSAQRWVGDLDADMGGTEMAGALESTFAIPQPADMLLITDGEIEAIDRTIDTARRSGHRVFIVGIGSSPVETHLRRLAEATGGACEFIAPGEAVEAAIMRMFHRVRCARVDGLNVIWPNEAKPVWMSALPASAFDGDTLNVFALFDRPVAGRAQLTAAREAKGPMIELGQVRFDRVEDNADALSRMGAFERVKMLGASGRSRSDKTAAELAVTYQLITEATSFVLIDEREAKFGEMPPIRAVAQMVAAGWGASAGVVNACVSHDMYYESLPSSVNEISPKVRFSVGDLHVDALFSRQMNQKATAQLTPISLARSLQPTNANAAIARLRTVQALADFGVPSDLGTWLATEVSDPSRPERDEPHVVAAILWLMALPEVLAALESGTIEDDWLQSIVEPLIDGAQFDRGMVEQLVEHLGGMTAEAWPA